MCTVSIVPRSGGFRFVCNRDELLSRPVALPPVRWTFGGVPVWHPLDPQGAGTWIAANGHGLVVALLNRQQQLDTPDPGETGTAAKRSRGQIVLALAGASGIVPLRATLGALEPSHYPAFSLVAIVHRDVIVATSNGQRLSLDDLYLSRPLVFTSSSLSDSEAEKRRLPLFDALVLRSRDCLAGQQTFHDHRWRACSEFSVRMRRADARTVSRTAVDVIGRQVSLIYEPLPVET